MALLHFWMAVPLHLAVVYLASGVASLIFLRAVFRAVFTPLRSVPGPFLARFSRLWYLYKLWEGNFEKVNIELHRKYGSIVRVSPYEYSIDDPAAVRPIYGHGTRLLKGHWYDGSSNPDFHTEELFSDRDPKVHAANRRKFSSVYTMGVMLKMKQPVDECIELFVQILSEALGSGGEMDLRWSMQCFAFDAIAAISVAKRFGFLDSMTDPFSLISTLDGFLLYSTHVGVYSEVHKLLFRIVKRIDMHGSAKAMEFAISQVKQRLEDQKDPEKSVEGQDFLVRLLRMHQEEPRNIRMEDVIGIIWGNFLAGSDTTSLSLTSIIYHLCKTPRALSKLLAEIDEKNAAGELSNPVTFAEAQRMQAVIQEGIRIHPAVGMLLPRIVPAGGVELAGRHIPEGTTVGINVWVAHRNKQVFGSDAVEFNPDRWLQSTEQRQVMERYFLLFGHGSRTCIGKNISIMEISKLVPTLLRKFDFQLASPEVEVDNLCRAFIKQKNIKFTVRDRIA